MVDDRTTLAVSELGGQGPADRSRGVVETPPHISPVTAGLFLSQLDFAEARAPEPATTVIRPEAGTQFPSTEHAPHSSSAQPSDGVISVCAPASFAGPTQISRCEAILFSVYFRAVWVIQEHKNLEKQLAEAPLQIRRKYEVWKNIVRQSGPEGLREIKGFHDEALAGKLKGKRSSRLNEAWRVLYQIDAEGVTVRVERVSNHDYS